MADFTLPRWAWDVLRKVTPVVLTDDVERMGLVDGVVREFERMLAAAPVPARLALLAGLGAFNAGAGRRGFVGLGPAEAADYFDRWWHSPAPPMNQLAKGVKALLTFGYYELPGVQVAIGYDPQAWIDKMTAVRIDKYGDRIAKFEADVLTRDPIPRTGPAPAKARGPRKGKR